MLRAYRHDNKNAQMGSNQNTPTEGNMREITERTLAEQGISRLVSILRCCTDTIIGKETQMSRPAKRSGMCSKAFIIVLIFLTICAREHITNNNVVQSISQGGNTSTDVEMGAGQGTGASVLATQGSNPSSLTQVIPLHLPMRKHPLFSSNMIMPVSVGLTPAKGSINLTSVHAMQIPPRAGATTSSAQHQGTAHQTYPSGKIGIVVQFPGENEGTCVEHPLTIEEMVLNGLNVEAAQAAASLSVSFMEMKLTNNTPLCSGFPPREEKQKAKEVGTHRQFGYATKARIAQDLEPTGQETAHPTRPPPSVIDPSAASTSAAAQMDVQPSAEDIQRGALNPTSEYTSNLILMMKGVIMNEFRDLTRSLETSFLTMIAQEVKKQLVEVGKSVQWVISLLVFIPSVPFLACVITRNRSAHTNYHHVQLNAQRHPRNNNNQNDDDDVVQRDNGGAGAGAGGSGGNDPPGGDDSDGNDPDWNDGDEDDEEELVDLSEEDDLQAEDPNPAQLASHTGAPPPLPNALNVHTHLPVTPPTHTNNIQLPSSAAEHATVMLPTAGTQHTAALPHQVPIASAPVLGQTVNISLPTPPTFSGIVSSTGISPENWLEDIVNWSRQAQRPLRHAVQSLSTDFARTWIRELLRTNPDIPDNELISAYTETFMPELANRRHAALRDLHNGSVQQGASEKLESYVVRFQCKLTEANVPVNKQNGPNICIWFQKGLKSSLRHYAACDNLGRPYEDYKVMLAYITAKNTQKTVSDATSKQDIPSVAAAHQPYNGKGDGNTGSWNDGQNKRNKKKGGYKGKNFDPNYKRPYQPNNGGVQERARTPMANAARAGTPPTGKRGGQQPTYQSNKAPRGEYSSPRGTRPDKQTIVEELRVSMWKHKDKKRPSVYAAFNTASKFSDDPFLTYYNRHLDWEQAHHKTCIFCHSTDHLESDCPYRR